jgi:hypothetical protein
VSVALWLQQAATCCLRSKWMELRHGEKWLGCIPAICGFSKPPPARFGGAGPVR